MEQRRLLCWRVRAPVKPQCLAISISFSSSVAAQMGPIHKAIVSYRIVRVRSSAVGRTDGPTQIIVLDKAVYGHRDRWEWSSCLTLQRPTFLAH